MSTNRHQDSSQDWSWELMFLRLLPIVCIFSVTLLRLGSDPAFGQQGPVRSLQEIRQEGVVIQRWDTSCGAAALATVLTYSLQYPVAEREVASGMLRMTEPLKVKHQGGFSLLDLKHFVQTRGFTGTGYRAMDLEKLLSLNSPIVPIMQYGNPHFVVVRGLDAYGRVNIADPGFGNRSMSVDDFRDVWTDGIAFVVTR